MLIMACIVDVEERKDLLASSEFGHLCIYEANVYSIMNGCDEQAVEDHLLMIKTLWFRFGACL